MARRALLVLFLVLVSGCEPFGVDPCACSPEFQLDLEVHLGSDFNDDRVRVAIDGREVFDDRVTTNHVLSLAEVIELQRPPGRYRIDVQVNHDHQAWTTFDLDRPLFVGVGYHVEPIPRYNIAAGIAIHVTDTRPVYD